MRDKTMKKLTFTVPEVGNILGIGRNLAYDSIRRNEIRAVRIGKRLVVPRSEIQRLLGEPTADMEPSGQDAGTSPLADSKS
jgi:excisionase family DNA binding protein